MMRLKPYTIKELEALEILPFKWRSITKYIHKRVIPAYKVGQDENSKWFIKAEHVEKMKKGDFNFTDEDFKYLDEQSRNT